MSFYFLYKILSSELKVLPSQDLACPPNHISLFVHTLIYLIIFTWDLPVARHYGTTLHRIQF